MSDEGTPWRVFAAEAQARFAAAGWHVQTADGQNVAALDAALEAAKAETERPSIIVMRTTIGYGSPAVAGKSKAHGAPLGSKKRPPGSNVSRLKSVCSSPHTMLASAACSALSGR